MDSIKKQNNINKKTLLLDRMHPKARFFIALIIISLTYKPADK